MIDPAAYRRQIKALITHDRETARQLNKLLSPADRTEFNEYLDAVFTIVVNWRFSRGYTVSDAATLADHVAFFYRRRRVAANECVIEDVILGALGETRLLDEVPMDRKANAQTMVIGTMADEDSFLETHVDDFLDRADALFDKRRDHR